MRDDSNPPTAGPDEEREGALRADAQRPSSTPSHSPPPAEGAIEKDLNTLVAEAEEQRDDYLELAQRTKADFENYRKRMAAEVQAAATRGKAELAASLIGVVDNLERALEAAGIESGAEAASDDPVAQGIVLTFRELRTALERAGVEPYDPAGERFDPSWHEALQKMPVADVEPGTVVEVVQKGYRLGDQVLRPARVVVGE